MSHNRSDSRADEEEEKEAPEVMPLGYQPNPPHLDGVPEMVSLIYLEEENVVHNLRCRYERTPSEIYTNIQDVMIAVNPYEELPIYGEKEMQKYRNKKRHELAKLAPHCYRVAEESYQNMARSGMNQSMVICGESGSGKTESAKTFMRYLAHVTGEKEGAIEEQFLQANPVLESFGNAQTNMNNNSSRYGRFMKVTFQKVEQQKGKELVRPRITGSFIETYLLEKSRVVNQERGERNYHIFYQLCKGASKTTRKDWDLNDWKDFHYMNQSGTYDIAGISDEEKFKETGHALQVLGFDDAKMESVWRSVAGILHLGNIEFKSLDADSCVIDETHASHMAKCAELYAVDRGAFEKRLTTRSIKVGAQKIDKPLSVDEATYNRDAISKALYKNLFDLIVRHINKVLFTVESQSDVLWIGILDVFGFEQMENNSFEQFCINFANERLQQYFNEHIILGEQQEYMREALPWAPLEVDDNADTIDLVQSKPSGIVAILDSTCVMPKGSDAIFINNVFTAHRKHPRIKEARTRPISSKSSAEKPNSKHGQRDKFTGFIIDHYAAKVTYNAEGFMDKNNDSTHADTVELFASSSNATVAEILSPPSEETKGGDAKRGAKPAGGQKTFSSVGSYFLKQMDALMATLRSTQPHFVRCVNPNQFKMSEQFDREYVRPQLRYGGIIEALRILKLGFPSRVPYTEIFDRYGHIIKVRPGVDINKKDFAEAVFLAFGMNPKEYQLGLTKVFFRTGKQQFLEQVLDQPELPPETVAKVQELMVRNRLRRVKAGLFLAVRANVWVRQERLYRRLSNFMSMIGVVSSALTHPLRHVKRTRAARAMQTSVRTFLARRELLQARRSVRRVQHFVRNTLRRRTLAGELARRIEATRDRRKKAAHRIEEFVRHVQRKRSLGDELKKRVQATRERKARNAAMEEAKRKKEEEERRRKLEEERKKAEEDERKRRVKEEEERKRREEEERKRREEEAKRKKEADELRRKTLEEEEKRRMEGEEQRKREQEALRAVEEERRKKEEAEKVAAEEARKAREVAAAEKAKRWQEALQRQQELKAEEERLHQIKDTEERAAAEAAYAEKQRAEKIRAAQEREDAVRQEAELHEEEEQARLKAGLPRRRPPPPAGPIPTHILEQHRRRQDALRRARAISTTGAADMIQLQRAHTGLDGAETPEHIKEPEPQREESPEEIAAQLRQVLLNGSKFLKYGKRGQPHIKHVCMNVLGNLHWSNTAMDPRKIQPSPTFIRLKDVKMVVKGKESVVFQRKVAKNAPDFLCFSVVTGDRTLDFQAINVKERDMWIRAIESAVHDAKDGMTNMITGQKQSPEEGPPTPSMAGSRKANTAASAMTAGKGAYNLADAEGLRAFLEFGEQLTKYGRMGKPKRRYFNVAGDRLYWGESSRPSTSVDSSFALLSDVQSVRVGKVTDIFHSKTASSIPAEHCFSLILKSRTLDLQAESTEHRNAWVTALTAAVQQSKTRAHEEWLSRKRSESITQHRSITGRTLVGAPAGSNAPSMARARSATTLAGGIPNVGGVRMRGFTASGLGGAGYMHNRAASGLGSMGGSWREESSESRSGLPPGWVSTDLSETSVSEVPEQEDGAPVVEDGAPAVEDEESEEPAQPSLPKVIAAMARRGSVEIMAAHMRRNMERQARMQSMSRGKGANQSQNHTPRKEGI